MCDGEPGIHGYRLPDMAQIALILIGNIFGTSKSGIATLNGEKIVTLAVTFMRRSYGMMLNRKAEPACTGSSHEDSDQEHL